MNTRDQFGNYLLLKKLTEDALGETFRGGRIGRQSLDRVVLLRVYNGQGLDSERIAKTIQSRGGLAAALKSPNVASAVDSGQVRGVPYVAYDYVSGRTLAQLAEQAIRRGQPVPLDHALLIAERIASGLAVAYETRFGEDRLSHGVLTPHEVWVSHEGELRIAGFEAAPGVRAAAGHPVLKQALGRYLAPEALSGQPLAKNDDVYSVASILFELLTAQPTPPMPSGGFGSQIEQAVVAADGGNLHPDLSALLQRSLCPRDQRVGDIVAWHKSLAKLMADGQYNPTTFNLAFFLHNLFRDEIERETQELETERTQAIQIPAPVAPPPAARPAEALSAIPEAAAPAAGAAAAGAASAGAVRENTDVLRDMYGIPEKKSGGRAGMIAAIAGGAVVALAVASYFLFFRGAPAAQTETAAVPAAAETAAPAPAEPVAPAPAAETGPSQEEIQAQIAKMVEEQSKQLEAGLKQKYDEQLRALQKQLESARQTEESRPQPAPISPRPVAPAPLSTSTPSTSPAQEPAAKPATTTAKEPAATATTRPAQPETAPATTPPAKTAAPEPAKPEPKPAAPAVKLGDLVAPGPGVVPPRIVRKPPLRYPPVAQRMRKEANVTVSVLIDHNGEATQVKQISPKVGFGLDEAAADYAREISWAPATKDGVRVKMWYDLRVAFTLSAR